MLRVNRQQKAFLLSFSITLLVLLALGGAFIAYYYNAVKAEAAKENQPVAERPYQYSEDEPLTMLIMGNPAAGQAADLYLLVRYEPQDKGILLCGIPASLTATVNIKTGSITDLFEYGSDGYVIKAVENVFDIKIDRRLRFTDTEAATLIDSLGGTVYDVPKALSYRDPSTGAVTQIDAGEQVLDGRRVLALARGNGEEDKAECANEYAKMTAALIQSRITESFVSKTENFFDQVLNMGSTDLTAYDFIYRADGLVWFIGNAGAKVSVVLLSGDTEENGGFLPDKESIDRVKNMFPALEEEQN